MHMHTTHQGGKKEKERNSENAITCVSKPVAFYTNLAKKETLLSNKNTQMSPTQAFYF